jgi:hypothetical protein
VFSCRDRVSRLERFPHDAGSVPDKAWKRRSIDVISLPLHVTPSQVVAHGNALPHPALFEQPLPLVAFVELHKDVIVALTAAKADAVD